MYIKNRWYIILCVISNILSGQAVPSSHIARVSVIDDTTLQVNVPVSVDATDWWNLDTLSCSINDQRAQIKEWKVNAPTGRVQDRNLGRLDNVIKGPFELTVLINSPQAHALLAQDNQLFVSCYQCSAKSLVNYTVPLNVTAPVVVLAHGVQTTQAHDQDISTSIDIPDDNQEIVRVPGATHTVPSRQSWTSWIDALFSSSNSWTFRILLTFLLGLLMSLTPCIYPMIPITVGILQSQASKSVGYNFLLSCAYSSGMALTFAAFGMLAAFSGQVFGSIMAKPWFILLIVALLVYLALSMIGLYEMYIPRFMQPRASVGQKGSLLSVFLFGAASGTFASPCLSPGLMLLLSMVTQFPPIYAFSLLFAFGIGLSVPLLLVGTFSSSLSMLPQAGMWMVEVKKFLGFILLGLSLYFVKNIVPVWIVWWLLAMLLGVIGIYYAVHVKSVYTPAGKRITGILSILLIAASVLTATHAFRATYLVPAIEATGVDSWLTDYESAVEIAQATKRYIFVDVGSPCCTICKLIDTTLFADPIVQKALEKYVPVHLDGTADCSVNSVNIPQKYKIIGFPTILVIDPASGNEIKRWGPELYGANPISFAQELNSYVI